MRYRTRADANQKEIDKALRGIGATVVSLGNIGKGCGDILVGFRGTNFLIETKNRASENKYSIKQRENGMRTPDQTKFHAEWQGQIDTAYTIEDALRIIGAA